MVTIANTNSSSNQRLYLYLNLGHSDFTISGNTIINYRPKDPSDNGTTNGF